MAKLNLSNFSNKAFSTQIKAELRLEKKAFGQIDLATAIKYL